MSVPFVKVRTVMISAKRILKKLTVSLLSFLLISLLSSQTVLAISEKNLLSVAMKPRSASSYPNWFVSLSTGSGFSGTSWSASWGDL